MYLREMGGVELLSRDGEIAIAKRIEAGKNVMLEALSQSPITANQIKDWNEKLTKKEKNLVGNILLGFAQTECAVSDYWTQKVVSWFPKHEIQQMAMMFGSQETIHAVAYSYLNETLGLENFEAFLQDKATMERFDNNRTFRKIAW